MQRREKARPSRQSRDILGRSCSHWRGQRPVDRMLHRRKRCMFFRSQEKVGLGKGVSAESSVTPKKAKNSQGYWTQQYIWHSECHSQERHRFLQKTPSKNPLLLALEFSEICILEKGALERGIRIKLSRNDKFATSLRILPLIYETKFRDGETTLKMKFAFLRGGGRNWGQRKNRPKCDFSWETPRQ